MGTRSYRIRNATVTLPSVRVTRLLLRIRYDREIPVHSIRTHQDRVRIKGLEARLSQNSSNSSKPPSGDLYKPMQTRSLRERGSNKPGHNGMKALSAAFNNQPFLAMA